MATATAISPSTVLAIEKKEMIRALHAEHALCDRFIAFMLARKIRLEEELVDQLSLIQAKEGWPVGYCCSLVMASRASLKDSSPTYRKAC